MNMLDLYYNGYYLCKVSSKIMHFPLKKLDILMSERPIKSRKYIALSSDEIKLISGLSNKELGNMIQKIEESILLKEIPNEKEAIKKFILRK